MKQKRLGQCFLNSHGILTKEASVADVKGKSVLEIGAGDGRLTQKLLEAGARNIITVEKDREWVEKLQQRFQNEQRIKIAEGDFLKMDFPPVDRIVGNIPYYITSPIVFRLKELRWEIAILMVQKEFADKMLAKPNASNYGRLSVTAQLAFDITYVQTVSRGFFAPQPKVDSAMVLLRPGTRTLNPHQEEIIRILFQHKNQTIRNALKHGGIKEDKKLEKWLQRRVRTLAPAECLEIAQALKKTY